MKLSLSSFSGIRPKLTSSELGNSEGQTAKNARLDGKDIAAFQSPSLDTSLTGTAYQACFQYKASGSTHWLAFNDVADAVKSPIVNEAYERLYVTLPASAPRVYANDLVSSPFDQDTDYYLLGVAAPTAALTVEGGGSLTRYYAYTYVTAYGEEGAPSTPAGGATVATNPEITGILSPTANHRITKIYLYRTASGTADVADFRWVLEATWFDTSTAYDEGDYVIYSGALYCTNAGGHAAGAWNAAHFTAGDAVADADLATTTLITSAYLEPPATLKGLVAHPAGFLAGFVGNTVYMSGVGLPHTWQYKEAVYEDIVALAVFGESIVVLTNGRHYLLTGSHPDSMSKTALPTLAPCLSKTSVTTTTNGVLFAAKTGLMLVDGSDVRLATEKFCATNDWDDYYPATMVGVFYEGKYFGWYISGTNKGGIILDFDNALFSTNDLIVYAVHVSSDGYLYLLTDDETGGTSAKCIKKWEGDTYNYNPYTWKSKLINLPCTTTFSAARIYIDTDFYNNVLTLLSSASYLSGLNEAMFASVFATLFS